MRKQEVIECLNENTTCSLREPRELAINALQMQIEIENCINGCVINTGKILAIISKYLIE